MTARLRTYLLAGIVVTAPIGITIYLAVLFVEFVDGQMRGLVPAEYDPTRYLPFDIPGLGVLALLLMLLVVGFFAAGLIGRMVFRLGESLIDRVPVVRSVYGALKQIFETVFADSVVVVPRGSARRVSASRPLGSGLHHRPYQG